MSRLFTSDDQNTGASASVSVLPVNVQDRSPLRLTGLTSLLSKGLSGVFSSNTIRRHQVFGILPSLQYSFHNHTLTLDYTDFVSRVMFLLFNTLSWFVISFPPRSNCLFDFMAAVTICSDFGAQEICHYFHLSPSICLAV